MSSYRFRSVWISLGAFLVALALAEAGLRALHPLPDPYRANKQGASLPIDGSPYIPRAVAGNFRTLVEPEPGLLGVNAVPHFVTYNAYGMRGGEIVTPKPADEYRVFIVGASSTECLLLDDDATLVARLEKRLDSLRQGRVRVYSAARSGDRSFDNVAMVAHRVAHLEPDLIVVFAGINDLGAAMQGQDYVFQATPAPVGLRRLLLLAATEFQVPRLIRMVTEGPERRPGSYRAAVARYAALPPASGPPRTDVASFRDNIVSIAGIARAHRAKVVLMTQATSWNTSDAELRRWHWMTGRTARYPEAALDSALETYNDAVRSVGAEFGVPVFDLSRAVGKTRDIFYDDVHFNAQGADSTAVLLSRFLIRETQTTTPW